jgi:O-antigen/teichoic acid export membrane protein
MQKSFDALAVVTLPMVFGTFFVANELMAFVVGEEFFASGQPLRPIMIATGILFFGQLFGHALVAIDKQRRALFVYGLGAIIGLVTYFSVIPGYSYMGAAWATVVVEATVNVILLYLVYRYTTFFPGFRVFAKSFAASMIMATVMILVSGVHVMVEIGIAMVVYGVCIFLFGAVRKSFFVEVFGKPS